PCALPFGSSSSFNIGPLQAFTSASVSFSFEWKERYDQAGLLLSLRKGPSPDHSKPPQRWIKAGVEFYNGSPMLSTVACQDWADWSVTPHHSRTATPKDTWTTILVQREADENGISLWFYLVLDNGDKVPLREVTWVFGDEPESWELEVLAMAARPATGEGLGHLEVEMKNMDVQWNN
ncbi:MAG: hypothetical protein Q9227_008726, partial [Pyrenula ochraceoflavens]